MIHKVDWHNPPRWCRPVLAGLALAMPGILVGMMVALFAGNPILDGIVGAFIGVAIGVTMELWPKAEQRAREVADLPDFLIDTGKLQTLPENRGGCRVIEV